MFRHLAEGASVPVVAHLDHGYTYDECSEALDSGFTSLMFDGSRTPMAQNIADTLKIAEMAHGAGISCEGEIGFVGYSNGEQSAGTDPEEAAIFARETGVDAMAISVGNVHLQENKEGGLDEARIAAIQTLTDVPLVIHGGSGVPVEQRAKLAKTTNICKYNIGTELRMAFGAAMQLNIACAVSFYGTRLTEYLEASQNAPIMGHFGIHDDHTPAAVLNEVRESVSDLAMFIYDAGHGFGNEARSAYVPAATELAHQRTAGFLAQHLKA